MNINALKKEIEKTYIVTRDGTVFNRKTGKEIVFPLDYKGYKKTRLRCHAFSKNEDHRLPFRVHRLVAMFYLKDFSSKLQVNHKNGIKTDNRIENLEMVVNQYNAWHGWNIINPNRRKEMRERMKNTPSFRKTVFTCLDKNKNATYQDFFKAWGSEMPIKTIWAYKHLWKIGKTR